MYTYWRKLDFYDYYEAYYSEREKIFRFCLDSNIQIKRSMKRTQIVKKKPGKPL